MSADDRTWLRTGEAAEIFHVSPKTLARWAAEGKVPRTVTMGGHYRYDREELLALRGDWTTEREGR